MSTTPPNPTPPNGSTPQSVDLLELFKFLAEQTQKDREALREESIKVRQLFIITSTIVSVPLGAAILFASWLFHGSLNEMKDGLIKQGNAEAQVEIQRMDEQIDNVGSSWD
jgi:hypothetical protein